MTTETYDNTYMTAEESGPAWRLMLGDSCERLAEIETDSVDLSCCSPPFAQLYNYSPSVRDLSNSRSRGEFFDHYRFIIREQLRVTKPGRVAAVHVADITQQKVLHGVIGLTDFSGEVVRAFVDEGWIFDGRITIDKDPQAQAIRTKSHSLLFVTKDRDSTMLRPALPDYLLKFRKPGENPVPVKSDVTNEEWIAWARPTWLDIKETNTLNTRVAKDDADERHICPLQLDFIERCVRLWSAPGELVLTPFAGIGSEVYTAVKFGRRGLGIELKPSYWRTAVDNLRALDHEMALPTLFDSMGDAA
ncbi:DNA methyltransferase [Micromonosporaceae bacterium B7E4]